MNELKNEEMNEQEMSEEPVKKPFFKRWWWMLIVGVIVVIVILLTSKDPIQDDLMDYLNEDLTEVNVLYEDINELFDVAKNLDDDYSAYVILETEIIPMANELIEKAEALDIKTDEVKEIHEIWIDSLYIEYQAYTLMLSALENQDYGIITQVNEKFDESRKLVREYDSALEKLAQAHDVEIIYE